jgi:hypothetical protein
MKIGIMAMKIVNGIVDFNPSISVMPLNISSLNVPIKREICCSGSKKQY